MYAENGMHAVQRSSHVFNGLWSDLAIEQVLMRSLKSRGGLTHGRGVTESVRQQWVYTMHHCTSLHEAMTSLTCKKHETSDQHVDMGKTRQTRDTDDLHKLIAWFDDNTPYDPEVKELKSLSTGLTSKTGDKINCDEAESVGQRIQCEMDDVAFSGAKIKRSSRVKTLQDLQPGIKIGEKMFHVDPGILLLRCVEIARRTGEDIESYFKYELSTEPSSLFQDNFMRHREKSVLANTRYNR